MIKIFIKRNIATVFGKISWEIIYSDIFLMDVENVSHATQFITKIYRVHSFHNLHP